MYRIEASKFDWCLSRSMGYSQMLRRLVWSVSKVSSLRCICRVERSVLLNNQCSYSRLVMSMNSKSLSSDTGVGGRGEALGLRHSAKMIAMSRMLLIIAIGRGWIRASRMVASSLARIRFLCRSESVNPM